MKFQQSGENLADQTSIHKLNQTQEHKLINTIPNKGKNVTCIEIYDNTAYLGTRDSKVFTYELWDTSSDDTPIELLKEKSFYPHCNSVHFICASEKLLIVVPLQEQQLIRIWNRETLQILHGYKGHENQITQVIYLQDEQHIASVSYDGTARIWIISQNFEFDTERVKFTCKYPLISLEELDRQTILFGGDDCFISIWNWKTKIMRNRVFAHPGSVLCLALYFPFLISAGGDSKLQVWKIQDEIPEETLKQKDMSEKKPIGQSNIIYLRKINTINESLSSNLFATKRSNKQLMLLDSSGNLFSLNYSLNVSSRKIPLTYTEKIKSMRIWEKYIFFVCNNSKGKGELRYISIANSENCNDSMESHNNTIATNIVEIKSKHSLDSDLDISLATRKRLRKQQTLIEPIQ